MLRFNEPSMKIEVDNPMTHKKQILNVQKDLEVNSDLLDDELTEQSSKYAWYGVIYSNAKYNYEEKKARLNKVETEVDHRIRNEAEYKGRKKPSETAMLRYIHGDDQYIQAVSEVNEAKRKADIIFYILQAFEQRINALITLGANIRSEKKQFGADNLKF